MKLPVKVPRAAPREVAPDGGTAASHEGLLRLAAAALAWREHGKSEPLGRWLRRELDAEGVPMALPVVAWPEGLRIVHEALTARPEGWPDSHDAMAEAWFRATLRFSRPDGSPAFSTTPPPPGLRGLYRAWAERACEPGLSTVLDWWFPSSGDRASHVPPPLPADARADRPLATLRANWLGNGDFLAVDHREAGADALFELFGGGRTWLGPTWSTPISENPAPGRARPVYWESRGSADVFEWSFRVGPARVTRTAVLFRGRKLALLGEQWDGPGDPGETRIALPEGIAARPAAESRILNLARSAGRGSASVLPIGLPRLPYTTDRGHLIQSGRELALRQALAPGQARSWRPLVISWDATRNRRPVHWRILTVSEKSSECPPGTAFAARVTWGRDDTLLVYRSLGKPGLRAFLGHQSRARFLVGLFDRQGEVTPLVKLEESP